MHEAPLIYWALPVGIQPGIGVRDEGCYHVLVRSHPPWCASPRRHVVRACLS